MIPLLFSISKKLKQKSIQSKAFLCNNVNRPNTWHGASLVLTQEFPLQGFSSVSPSALLCPHGAVCGRWVREGKIIIYWSWSIQPPFFQMVLDFLFWCFWQLRQLIKNVIFFIMFSVLRHANVKGMSAVKFAETAVARGQSASLSWMLAIVAVDIHLLCLRLLTKEWMKD